MVNNGNLLWKNIENPNSEDLKSLALRYPLHELNLKGLSLRTTTFQG